MTLRPAKLALAAALTLAAHATVAQDKPTELKLAHWVPANHLLAQTGFIPWGKSIEQASGGSIKVNIFPAQQLGKAADHYDMARDGIATVTMVNPGYQAGRFPIIAAGELPFLLDKPGPAAKALDGWYRRYAEREMGDVKVCLVHLHVGTLHAKKPISDPDQIKGMKIRPANGTVASMVSLLGGSSVQVSAPEARDALARGLADAITFPWNSISAFGIDRVVNHHMDMRLYAAVFVWAMNKPWYQGLTAAQKKVMDDHCNNEWATRIGNDWGNAEDAGRQKLAAKGGHTFVPVSAEQVGKWRTAVAPLYDKWVADADRAGINGRQALQGLRDELKRTGGAY